MTILERIQTYKRLLHYRFQANRAEMRFLLSRQNKGGSILDVGAHRGEFSYWLHRQFPRTPIVSFEPQPELVDYLTRFKAAFELDRMSIAPIGLSSRAGTLKLHRPRARWAAATFDDYCYDNDEIDVLDVPVTTIDQYLDEHPELRPVRFIKCDAAFHEAEVLVGAERTLREDRPELMIEWSSPRRAYREKLFALVQRLGYAMFQFEYGHLVPCVNAERHSPPSWELGANYVLLPLGATASAAA